MFTVISTLPTHGGFFLCFMLFWKREGGRNAGDLVACPNTKNKNFFECVCLFIYFFTHRFELFCLESQGSEAYALYFYEIFVSVVRGIGQERLRVRKIQGEKFWS